MLHMHCIIPYMFDCWANKVAHLLLLKSSMVKAQSDYMQAAVNSAVDCINSD